MITSNLHNLFYKKGIPFLSLCMTLRAYSLYYIFIFVGKEALGKGDNGDGLVFEAVGGAALGAGEMDVVEVMGVVATAKAVLLDA